MEAEAIGPDSQILLSGPGGAAVTLTALLASAALVHWASRPGHTDRWAVAAAGGSALVVAGSNALAASLGWWLWAGYGAPLVVLAAALFLWPALLFALLLLGYRRLAARRRQPLPIYLLATGVVIVPASIGGDTLALGRGWITFGGGYQVWHDVLVGLAFCWLPALLYELLLRLRVRGVAPAT